MAEIAYTFRKAPDGSPVADGRAFEEARRALLPALSTGLYRLAPRNPNDNFASPKERDYTLRLELNI